MEDELQHQLQHGFKGKSMGLHFDDKPREITTLGTITKVVFQVIGDVTPCPQIHFHMYKINMYKPVGVLLHQQSSNVVHTGPTCLHFDVTLPYSPGWIFFGFLPNLLPLLFLILCFLSGSLGKVEMQCALRPKFFLVTMLPF